MAWFLFAGDMLVMLFMTVLVVWLSMRGTTATFDHSAAIPLQDETTEDEHG
jgi:hypothetical protein